MKKYLFLVVLAMFLSSLGFAQLTGIKTIPGNYATVAAAITDLNLQGVGTGGVTFNLTAGLTETFSSSTAGQITTLTGSAANPILFQKSGSGANPLITAATGTGTMDAVFAIGGCDFVTFDGINIQENIANTTSTTQMEWGYAILKASTSNGSQSITIKNCTITLNKANTASVGIYSNNHLVASITQLSPLVSAAGANSNLKIYSNNISNCYSGISISGFNHTSAPYDLFDQNNEIGKDGGNTITNFGGSSVAMNGIYTIYQNNLKVANNSFTGVIGGTAQCAAIQLGSSANASLDLYGNTITLQYTGTTGTFYGIFDNMGTTATNTNTINIYNNIVTGCSMPSATTGSCNYIYVSHVGPAFNFHHNTVSNNTYGSASVTGIGNLQYMYLFGNPTTKGIVDVFSNTISNNTRAQSVVGGGSTYFYYLGATGNTQNTYDNIAFNNITATSGGAYAFYVVNASLTKNFYNNTVNGIINANGTTMGFYNGSGTNLNVYNNIIKNLTSNSAASLVSGFVLNSLSSQGNMIVHDNFVSELYAPNSTNAAPSVTGISLNGQSANIVGLYNNTVYLDATSTGANFSSTGIYAYTNAVYNDFQNNIIINKSTPKGIGIASAFRYASAGLTNYSANSNNNNYYAGIPSASRVIYYDGTNSDQTLADFKLRAYPREIQSVTENTTFVNTATSPYNLHVNTATPSQVESGGTVISTPVVLTADIDGDARYPNAGYPLNASYPAVAPDMGADEFGGIPNDLTGPTINYSPLGFTASTLARTLTVTINDVHGVPTSGNGLPRLAWKKSANGIYAYATGTSIGSGKYNFTFGSGVSLGDTVYYFVVAQDEFSTPAVGVYPFAGAGSLSANPPTCVVVPTNPSYYYISSGLCGTYTVGAGMNYPTLTAAINDFNNKEITCPVVLQLTDATYPSETYPITIKNNPGSSAINTLTIKPSPGNSPVMAGISTDCAIKFNGARYIIIDGSNSASNNQNWTIQNNSSAGLSSVVKFSHNGIAGASNIIVKNCVLQSSLTGILATYGILMDNGTGTGGYTNLTIDNNTINTCRFGVFIGGPANNRVSNIQLTRNTIGSGVQTSAIERQGVQVQYADNVLIEGNEVMGFPNGTSANQMIGGIAMLSATNVKILGNKVHDWKPLISLVGANGFGIAYGPDAPTNGEISNNAVYNITFPGSTINPITGGNATGISIGNNVGPLKIYNNTVYLSGNYLASTGLSSSVCLAIGNNNTQLDVRNNILKNSSQPISGTPAANTFAIAYGTGCTFVSLDYNNYFVDGIGPNVGYLASAQATLADWQTATGAEVNSLNINPVFTSSTNLLPTAAALNNKAVYLASVPTDITGALRNNPMDMGAYEFGADPFVKTLTSNSVTPNSAVITGEANASGLTLTTYFDYGTTTAYGTSVAATPGTVTGSTTTSIQAPLAGLNFATTYHYRARSVADNGMLSYGVDSTFTTLPLAPTVITTAATSITSSGATLNGSVNPNGGLTSVNIQYGLTTAYGNTIAATPGTVSGLIAANVAGSISGLTPFTTYHYRVVATNATGTTNGNDMSFISAAVPSTVITQAASNIIGTTATLNGNVNANFAPTNVAFEWGLTTSYGNIAIASPAQVTGNTATPVVAAISGLATATIYHFRCVGTGPGGTVYGLDQVFTSDCPSPVLPGAISGLQSVCKHTLGVVYSIDAIPSATGYNWSVPAGASISTGSNTNSITVDFSVSAVDGNITVNGVNACGSGLSTSLPVIVNDLPVPTVSGPVSLCQGASGNVYTTQSGMTNYVWTVTGGTITAGAGTNSVTITWNTSGAQSVSVNYANNNGCLAVTPVSYSVTVLPLPVPVISGANTACESSLYLDYTTESGMTNYVWDMSPNSGTITQTGTNMVTIFWTAPGTKWVSVSYNGTNGCAAASPAIYNVTVNPLPGTPGTISGQTSVCAGATNVAYSVAAVSNATSYVWTLPAGATVASGSGTRSITVNFDATAASGDISVLAQNACGDGQASALALTVNTLPAATGTIIGESSVCQGSTGVSYSIAVVPGATSYDWTVPAGVTIASGATTNTITVDFSTSAVSGTITASGINSCGAGTPSSMAVTVNPKPATPVITLNVNILTSSSATGNQWYRDGVLIYGATSQTFTILQDGVYSVVVTLNGCSSDVSNSIEILHTGIADPDAQAVSVYPNPGNGIFWLSITMPNATVFNMDMLNSFGAVVYKTNNLEVNGTFKQHFDLHDLSAGMYTIVLKSDKQQIVKKIVINK